MSINVLSRAFFINSFASRFLQLQIVFIAAFLIIGSVDPVEAKAKFAAITVDARTGKILYSNDADGLRHPASLTKVMTLYLLFEDLKAGRIKLNTNLIVSKRAAGMAPSKLGFKPL
jgi:D-alanyl-D-alanine carboxypeptidase